MSDFAKNEYPNPVLVLIDLIDKRQMQQWFQPKYQ